MGAWSTAILGNDTSAETYEYFKRMYRYQEGNRFKWSVEQICDSLFTYNQDTIDLPTVKPNIFFALALALWEVNELDEQLKRFVHQLVEKRIDYNAWKELEADEKTLKQRWAVTEKFLEKLETVNDKPKKRQLLPGKLSTFILGDCLTLEVKGKYYGVLVANDGRNVDDGTNHFALTNIMKNERPTLDDFYTAELLPNEDFVNTILGVEGGTRAYPEVIFLFRLTKSAAEKVKTEFDYVGNLPMPRTHYERNSARTTDFPGKAASLKKIVVAAADYWKGQKLPSCGYYISSDTKATPYHLTASHLEFAGHKVPVQNIYFKLENSLWHINAWLYVKDLPADAFDNHWLTFVDIIGKRTGREVNAFTVITRDVDLSEFKPLDEIYFEALRMKHIKKQAYRELP